MLQHFKFVSVTDLNFLVSQAWHIISVMITVLLPECDFFKLKSSMSGEFAISQSLILVALTLLVDLGFRNPPSIKLIWVG